LIVILDLVIENGTGGKEVDCHSFGKDYCVLVNSKFQISVRTHASHY